MLIGIQSEVVGGGNVCFSFFFFFPFVPVD